MKVLCVKTCQVRHHDHILFVEKGEVLDDWPDDKKIPHTFKSLADSGKHLVDFTKASKAELLHAKWTLADARRVIKERYGVTLTYNEGETKEAVVEKILDARYRAADVG